MTILDYVLDVFSNFSGGTYFTTREIVDLVVEKHNVNRTSLIPSDYCYNLTNKAKEENPTLKRFKISYGLGEASISMLAKTINIRARS